MTKEEIKKALLALTESERSALLAEIEQSPELHSSLLFKRREMFNDKLLDCPHCGSKKYKKHGIEKGSQRYYCRSCKRAFNEFTGTWVNGLHKKELIIPYLKHMENEDSLDKIKESLNINKKTAFDWRHKILSSLRNVDNGSFTGITESDETFFMISEKGKKQTIRPARKRGGKAEKRGISNEKVAVLVTTDRKCELDISVATLGRLKKVDIETAIGDKVSDSTILCSDSHVSFKGFAIDNSLEHHMLRANLKEYVKGAYHIQHVNSIDNKLKKWIENRFWGVSTKYLQKYLNWFRAKERLKSSKEYFNDFVERTLIDDSAKKRFFCTSDNYRKLFSNEILN